MFEGSVLVLAVARGPVLSSLRSRRIDANRVCWIQLAACKHLVVTSPAAA